MAGIHLYYVRQDLFGCVLFMQQAHLLVDSDWNLYPEQWSIMTRCTKCGHQLYPYSSRTAYAWAESAFRRYQLEGETPEQIRDRQSPGIVQRLQQRPPRYFL